MARQLILLLTLILLAVLTTEPALAKPKEARPARAYTPPTAERPTEFTPAERNLIRSHLLNERRNAARPDHSQLPPGLQKKVARGKQLPPGWQKKLDPGSTLDYSVYRQGESLPDILLRRLPPAPVGTETLYVDDKVMRINAATRIILDVFDLLQGP